MNLNIVTSLHANELASKRSFVVITSPDEAKVLVDPMRREILRLLSGRPMTQNILAETLGLSNSSVAHHLKLLAGAGLVMVAREERELHGILQKFYETTSLAYFVDTRKLSLDIERYYMSNNLERARGILAALNMTRKQAVVVPTKDLEEFSRVLASAIAEVAPQYARLSSSDREEVISKVHHRALRFLLDRPELIPQTVKRVLMNNPRAT